VSRHPVATAFAPDSGMRISGTASVGGSSPSGASSSAPRRCARGGT